MPPSNFKDFTNQKFNRLTVICRAENTHGGKVRWRCKCACGNIAMVTSDHLRSGHTKSCGCLKVSLLVKRNTIHGLTNTPEYKTWEHIIQRCTNPNSQDFKDYGGRGITICGEWRNSFMTFFNHIGKKPSPKHSVDRIDNNCGYRPGNVRWATQQEQNNNCSRNRCITIKNHTMTMTQWATFVGIDKGTLWNRLKKNWPIEKAIFKPVRSHKPYSKNI